MRKFLLFSLISLAIACTTEPIEDDDDGGSASSSNNNNASGTGGGGGATGAGGKGAGAGPANGPETSSQSLTRQQSLHGWGPEYCPTGTAGNAIGQMLAQLSLVDCEGNPVEIDAICGADAGWLFFAHGW